MSLSRVQYTGSGSIALYSIPFAYISKAYIEVRVAGVLLAESVGFTWQSATSILLSAGNLGTGVTLDIRRATPKTAKLVDFQDGSVLTESALDLANDQVFQLVQESTDDMADRLAVQTDGTIDGQNRRIKNVADPINPQDAVTRNYADTYYGRAVYTIAIASAEAAQASAEEASLSAIEATAAAASISGSNPANFATAAQGVKADAAIPSSSIGTSAGCVVALDAGGKLPAVDGSQLTGVNIHRGVTINTTSGTAYDFTGIPAGVKRITVILSGNGTNGTSPYLIQLGNSGGIETTGYIAQGFNGSGTYPGAMGCITSTQGLPVVSMSVDPASNYRGHVTIENLEGNLWVMVGDVGEALYWRKFGSNADKTISGILDRIRFTTAGGTDVFDGGKINIFWEF